MTDAVGGITLTPYDPEVADEVERGREFRDTFHELAK